MVVVAVLAMVSATPRSRPGPDPDRVGARPAGADLVVAAGGPASWDPARIGDATSAAILAQTWEGLTTLDANAQVRPALARDWERRRTAVGASCSTCATASPSATARPSPARTSWHRGSASLDPAHPSPLAWLLGDVVGAREYLAGTGAREDVAIRADGGTVTVDFRRPAAFFPAAAASPTLGIVPGVAGGSRPPGRSCPMGPRGLGRVRPDRAGRDVHHAQRQPGVLGRDARPSRRSRCSPTPAAAARWRCSSRATRTT